MKGSDFKKHRKKLELSKKQLAYDLCVSKETIDSWETGRRNIPLSSEKLFCLLYDLPFIHPEEFKCIQDKTPDLFTEQ